MDLFLSRILVLIELIIENLIKLKDLKLYAQKKLDPSLFLNSKNILVENSVKEKKMGFLTEKSTTTFYRKTLVFEKSNRLFHYTSKIISYYLI